MEQMKTLTVDGNTYEVVDTTARASAAFHANQHKAGGSDPLTAADVGAIALDGSNVMTGNLQIQKNDPLIRLKNPTDDCQGLIISDSNGLQLKSGPNAVYEGTDCPGFTLLIGNSNIFDVARALQLQYKNGSTLSEYEVYHEANKPTIADLAYFGQNPLTSIDNDTTTKWETLGTGYAYFSGAGQVTKQPSTYGFVVQYVSGANISQIWHAMPSGEQYRRSGNASGWSDTWKQIATTDYALPRNGSAAMTASLRFDMASPLIAPKANSAATYMRMFSGTGEADAGLTGGAGIQLYNVKHSTEILRGRFRIHADDGTNNSVLYGTPDGILRWCDKDILNTGNSNMTRLVSADTVPSVDNEINWTYG